VIETSISITGVNTFAERLRQARQRRGWTQKQLAQASGLSQSAVGNYESGQRSSSRALLRLAHALQVAPEWLEGGGTATAYPPAPYGVADAAAAAWPFAAVSFQEFAQLTARDKALLERTVQAFVHACHDGYRQGGQPAPSRGAPAKRSKSS